MGGLDTPGAATLLCLLLVMRPLFAAHDCLNLSRERTEALRSLEFLGANVDTA